METPGVNETTGTLQAQATHSLPSSFANVTPPPQLIVQGAESLLYRTHYQTPSAGAALKIRPAKPWRHPTLDARLSKHRVLAEARILVKLASLAQKEFKVPAVYSVDWDMARRVKTLSPEQREVRPEGSTPTGGKGAWILMEWIDGFSVKEVLRDCDSRAKNAEFNNDEAQLVEQGIKKLLGSIGRAIGALHAQGGVVHGDLTTSNIMVRSTGPRVAANGDAHGDHASPGTQAFKVLLQPYEVVLIDFGLAMQGIQDEDRAVDLYVLERAFGSTHPRQEGWFNEEVLQSKEGYRGAWGGSKRVLKRLEDVRLRGRKRSMVG